MTSTFGIGLLVLSLVIILFIRGSYKLMKLLFKLLKFGIIIYLLIFFKNLYSETKHNIITVSTPDIIDITDLDNSLNELPSFSEQMDFYNPDTQQRLQQQIDQIKQAQRDVGNLETYKDSLQEGVDGGGGVDVGESYAYSGSGIVNGQSPQQPRRQLRDIGTEVQPYKGLPEVDANKPVPPAIIPLE